MARHAPTHFQRYATAGLRRRAYFSAYLLEVGLPKSYRREGRRGRAAAYFTMMASNRGQGAWPAAIELATMPVHVLILARYALADMPHTFS